MDAIGTLLLLKIERWQSIVSPHRASSLVQECRTQAKTKAIDVAFVLIGLNELASQSLPVSVSDTGSERGKYRFYTIIGYEFESGLKPCFFCY